MRISVSRADKFESRGRALGKGIGAVMKPLFVLWNGFDIPISMMSVQDLNIHLPN